MPEVDMTPEAVEARLEELGRLSREARGRPVRHDMSPEAVERRLRRVSQLRDLCVYLQRMGRESGLHDLPGDPASTRPRKRPVR